MSNPIPVVESLEQRLIKKHSENIKTLNERRKQALEQRAQIDAGLAAIEDQVKVLSGAIAGLNELIESRKAEEAPKAEEVSGG